MEVGNSVRRKVDRYCSRRAVACVALNFPIAAIATQSWSGLHRFVGLTRGYPRTHDDANLHISTPICMFRTQFEPTVASI